jgi:hypothetical protein
MADRVAVAAGNRRKHAHRRFRRNLLTGLAAALAAGTITAWFAWPRQVPMSNPAAMAATNSRDLNADGRVDMIDALLLAEHVDTGSASTALDLNSDGKVDRRDSDSLATDAVKLERGVL